ncbi:MAG: pyrimidine-nucleoside phosphorylase, partial [Clostridia bacterium]|nr:pyrimidine-nucleoside phosphorylase [Clostridia bacterium]
MQGGDVTYIDNPEKLYISPIKVDYLSKTEGYVSEINAESVGIGSMLLGAGRKTKDDVIDLGAGIVLKSKIGQYVKKGQALATMYTSNKDLVSQCEKMLDSAFLIVDTKPQPTKLIHAIIE